ncbi:50S ribosomal protein L11 methyltransferase [uncultured Oscillibacter sp.]|uniref:50S ribosomal protein L11 methyltransferase n=1 Tax=uncultured Oscillibacter sp. TaxID=876091 RepID=UPI0025F7B703|nr:50S ribosomal protein L11 methyltransferase [uncultured Oscillibacter sp.]
MDWMEVHIQTSHDGLETVEAFLSGLGIDGVVIDDETEFREFLEENRKCWDYVDEELLKKEAGACRVTFYLEKTEDGFSRLAQVRMALADFKAAHPECAPLLMTLDELKEEDWAFGWQKYYKPMEIGRRLLVVPEWEKDTVDCGGRVPLILDPGLAFGTGSHATTQLCLQALEKTVRPGDRVLDLGCGSGILSIAALKLGAESAQAVDIDEKCLNVAYENAALNGIGRDRYTVRVGDVLSDEALRAELGGGYDIVVANIVADVILGLAPMVRQFLKPGGQFLCSGIIDDRAVEVADGLRRCGWAILETREESGWFAYSCR